MDQNSLNSDVAAVVWTAGAGASTHDAAREGKNRAQKSRKPLAVPSPEPQGSAEEQASDASAHQIDSFA